MWGAVGAALPRQSKLVIKSSVAVAPTLYALFLYRAMGSSFGSVQTPSHKYHIKCLSTDKNY